eukprot:jgi/Orpsp1_1/1180777/evm.model.c7180000074607.1
MTTAEEVKEQINIKTSTITALKNANAPKEQIQAEAQNLLKLKAEYKTFNSNKNGDHQKKSTTSKNFTLKTPKVNK